ncbi:MAG: ankyrin repeat domain-containing protein [Geodermatophilaceae bacterium]
MVGKSVTSGAAVNAQGCLHWAIGRGRGIRILEMLLDAGADVNLLHPDVGARPLEVAGRCGHLAAYDLLAARGATAELSPVATAVLAVARGESAQLPAEPPPLPGIPSIDYSWILGQFALLGRVEIVQSLLDAGLAVDSRGWSNFTPLDQAAMHGRVEIVRLLIDRGP